MEDGLKFKVGDIVEVQTERSCDYPVFCVSSVVQRGALLDILYLVPQDTWPGNQSDYPEYYCVAKDGLTGGSVCESCLAAV